MTEKTLNGTEFREEADKALNYFTERICEFNFLRSIDGQYYDPCTNEKLHENAVVCMLRGDYIRSGGTLRGKTLDKIIKAFLEEVKNCVVGIFEDKNCLKKI